MNVTIHCPYCAETISAETKVCPYCGRTIMADVPRPPTIAHTDPTTSAALKQSHQPSWGRWTLIGLAAMLGLLLAWHFFLLVSINNRVRALRLNEIELPMEFSVSANPLTDFVSITIAMPPELDTELNGGNPFAAFGSILAETMIQAVGPGYIERGLNTVAREKYDLYAMLVPYRVRISTKDASPEAVAKMREGP